MPLPRPPIAEKRGPHWYLTFARTTQADRIAMVRDRYFNKDPEFIHDAAIAMAFEAFQTGHWLALVDLLPEMKRMAGSAV